MFLAGPFFGGPFLGLGSRGSAFHITAAFTVQMLGTTSWDSMLSNSRLQIAYRAELEPWVLTDRS